MSKTIILFILLFACSVFAKGPCLVPMPKHYTPTGGYMLMDGKNIIIAPGNKQCKIGAKEILSRLKELGGEAGNILNASDNIDIPAIYILPVGNDTAQKFINKYKLKITAQKPGPQGYVIYSTPNQYLIIGSDNVGALYGAMTMRQMLQKSAQGIVAEKAEIVDKPDFLYRARISFRRGIMKLANGEKDRMAAYKAGIDWLMRFKINKMDELFDGTLDARAISPSTRKVFAEVNQYAIDRGIIPHAWMHNTAYDGHTKPKGLDRKTWPCIYDSRPWYEGFYCWSADKENDKKVEASIRFLKECNIRQLTIHPVDGGGIFDPSLWSTRCPRCKARWKDNERWKATVHVMNKWIKQAEMIYPELIIGSCLYPYAVQHIKPLESPEKEAIRKQNVDEYRKHCNRELPKDFYMVAWASKDRDLTRKFMASFENRKIAFLGHYPNPLGEFTTSYRYYGASYFEDSKGDMFIMTSADGNGKWMSIICAAEFGWNTKGAGSEPWTGLYYDVLKDHSGPPVIINEWLPNVCRLFWGDKLGAYMARFYASDIWPRYVCFPDRVISEVNQNRLSPYAGTDPKAKKKVLSDGSKPAMIEDNSELMASQVKKLEFAWLQLQNAYTSIESIDCFKQKIFMYYYRRVPLWLMVAKARLAFREADRLSREGNIGKARKVLEQGVKDLKKNHLSIQALLEKCSKRPSLERLIVSPGYKQLHKKLSARLGDLTFVMKPRRVGRYIRIAVFDSEIAKGVVEYFETFENAKIDIIKDLSLSTLDQYDCVFIANSPFLSKSDFFSNLPTYVKDGGGGVVLEHTLCGSKRFEERTPFPEVVKYSPKRVEVMSKDIFTTSNTVLDLKANSAYKMMYVDTFCLEVGRKGFVIAVDKGKQPIVVGGEVGHGKIIFNGTIDLQQTHGYGYDKTVLTGFNASLAKAAVEWFTGVPLKAKK